MIVRLALIALLSCILWALSACSTRFSETGAPPAPEASVPVTGSVPPPVSGPTAVLSGPRPRVLPDLRHEPLLRVFLAQGAQLAFSTTVAATLADGRTLAAGSHRVQAVAGGLQLDGLAVSADCPLAMPEAATRFAAELQPPFGRSQSLVFAGLPILRLQGAQVQLLEEIPLERYLAGVLPVEMNPSWPVAALAAQAIAARSYAAARYLERFDRPWQLHWHFSVDMAYGGVPAKRGGAVEEALRSTRGRILTYRGFPLPALFHACSGGATEAAVNLWPELRAGDRSTPMAQQMPSVPDPDAEAGCTGLGLSRSHWRWKANLPLPGVSRDLQAWAAANPEAGLKIGTVTAVEIASRHPDSGRVSQVAISHQLDGRSRRTVMAAQDFRMAVDPGECRSTWWDRCLVAAAKSGKGRVLVLAGRGFGHGVGLSQVSAWQLARSGSDADAIVHRFYPTAALERRW